MEIGQEVPDFELPDQEGRPWRLSAYRGQVVALVFYPKDNTPVCTLQMCSMRDRWSDYAGSGAEVAAVSVGTVEEHRAFGGRHGLPQKLLADARGDVTRLLGVKSLLGGSQRAVVVIDPEGKLRYRKAVWPIFRPSDDEVLRAIADCAR